LTQEPHHQGIKGEKKSQQTAGKFYKGKTLFRGRKRGCVCFKDDLCVRDFVPRVRILMDLVCCQTLEGPMDAEDGSDTPVVMDTIERLESNHFRDAYR
jgi:hypothetical protein